MSDEAQNQGVVGGGISRRDILKRGAVVGGALWAAPVIQSLTSAAHAQTGSPVLIDHYCCQCSNPKAGQPVPFNGACNGADGSTGPNDDTPCECARFCDESNYQTYHLCTRTDDPSDGYGCGNQPGADEFCDNVKDASECGGLVSVAATLETCPA